MHDIVIRNGTVVDGSGLAGYCADVAVDDGIISRIGRVGERGAREIDAEGHVVTPGFIDGHTHMDAQVFWDSLGTCVCYHGVTTAVMGHCGFTLAPAAKADAGLVVRNLERAEDISGQAMAAGIEWTWTTFAEYLEAVDRLPKGINYAANLGHSALRTFAMGDRAFEDVASTEDIALMDRQLREALRAGAYGLTTSRSRHHETSDDRPVASRLAAWDEVEALVGVLGDMGAGMFQITYDLGEPTEQAEFEARLLHLAVRTRARVALGLTGPLALFNLALIDRIADAGGDAFGITHCRGIGTLSSFRTRTAFDSLPAWKPIRALPAEEQQRAFRDPAIRERLIDDVKNGTYSNAIGAEARPPDFDRMRVLDSPLPPNPTVAEAAAAAGKHPVEFILDTAAENFDVFFSQTISPFDRDAVKRLMLHPRTVTGFSDAGAHVSQMSDCSLPTHLLGHWVRDTNDFTLEEGVRMLTLEPARAWGFQTRGLVREGLVADLNVFDPETVAPEMPAVAHDLPAAQPRLVQRSTGIRATIVNGQVLLENGEHSGAYPGALVRGPLAAGMAVGA